MTEQPTEQEWLGNTPRVAPKQAYLPNGHRIAPPRLSAIVQLDIAEAAREELAAAAADLPTTSGIAPRDRMLLEAEEHAYGAVNALTNGELDEAIAWLQAALAFAQNYRHAVRFEVTGE